MTVTGASRNAADRTLTITSAFDAPAVRIWNLWEDPRQLERWWGPPTYPATFVEHDVRPGGRSAYFMTGPQGDTPHGWWRTLAADPTRRLEFENGFADGSGEPDPAMPVTSIRVTIEEVPAAGTRMTIVVTFPSPEAMDKILSMGMEEGMTAAMGQIDGLL